MKVTKFGFGSIVIGTIAFIIAWMLTSAFWPGGSGIDQVLHIILATVIGVFATLAFLGILIGLIAILI